MTSVDATGTRLRLLFAGTPEAAVPSLRALLESRHEVVAVLTRPDAPAGRGRRMVRSPVGALADEAGIPVLTPRRLTEPGFLDALRTPTAAPGLPKGISRESLDQVSGVLVPDAGRTAVEVADLVGVSRVTARRYLEHLADTGLAERTLRYGTTGRPQVEYTWRPQGGR